MKAFRIACKEDAYLCAGDFYDIDAACILHVMKFVDEDPTQIASFKNWHYIQELNSQNP